MPVHVEEMTAEVGVFEGDLPLNAEQIDKLVKIVLRRLEQKQREAVQSRDATSLRSTSVPRVHADERGR